MISTVKAKMKFDEFNDEKFFSKNKWIIVSIIVIIILIVNITLFMEYIPGSNFFSEISSANNAERQLTLVGDNVIITDGNSIDTVKTPQKIGSVKVNAGSMEQIEIKG